MRVKFPLKIITAVNGKETPTVIIKMNRKKGEFYFDVAFKDGFGGTFKEGNSKSPLLVIISENVDEDDVSHIAAIRGELPIVELLKKGQFYEIFRVPVNGILTNVWVIEEFPQKGPRCLMNVYYNQEHQFQMRRKPETDKWVLVHNYGGDKKTNLGLVELVSTFITAQILAEAFGYELLFKLQVA